MHDQRLLTITEAADYLAVKKSWLYAHPEVPRLKLGHGLRFKKADLEEWLTGQRVGA